MDQERINKIKKNFGENSRTYKMLMDNLKKAEAKNTTFEKDKVTGSVNLRPELEE